jgi:hypothetical protein
MQHAAMVVVVNLVGVWHCVSMAVEGDGGHEHGEIVGVAAGVGHGSRRGGGCSGGVQDLKTSQ